MSYLAHLYTLLDQRTRGRVAMCAHKLAQDVLNESVDVDDHERRAALARAIDRDPIAHGEALMLECLTNPTIAGGAQEDGTLKASDEDLEYVLTTRWSHVADRILGPVEV